MTSSILSALLAAAIGFGSSWYVQELRTHKQISELNKKHSDVLSDIKSKTEKNEKAIRKTYETALNKSLQRQHSLGIDSAASSAALIGLSNAANDALISSRDSLSACNATANTFRVVFGECSERYNKVAEDAQGHVIDKQTLIESWPIISE